MFLDSGSLTSRTPPPTPPAPTTPCLRILHGSETKYISTTVFHHSTICAYDDKQPWVWVLHHFLDFRLTTLFCTNAKINK